MPSWNLSQRNEQSVQRSKKAASDTSPAGGTGVPDTVRNVVSSSGHSLDGAVQRTMESRMGASFDDVQVHTGPQAASACEDISARAFTVGNHVAFNRGEYDPGSPEGQHVIAHELAHVRQQTGGAVSMLPQEGELQIDPDPAAEREAEETAQRVMEGSDLGIQRLADTEVHVQRSGKSKTSPDFQGDSPSVIEAREQLLEGFDIDGVSSVGALQQQGPSCLPTATLAGLLALGWDPRSSSKIIQNFPRSLIKPTPTPQNPNQTTNLLSDKNATIDDVLNEEPDANARSVVSSVLQDLDSQGKKKSTKTPATKGTAAALISLFKQRNYAVDQDVAAGQNLLRGLVGNELPDRPHRSSKIYTDNTVDGPRQRFVEEVTARKTPMMVSVRAQFSPRSNQIHEYRTSHALLVHGIRREEDGTTFVRYRDPNDRKGKPREAEIDDFLSIIDRTRRQPDPTDPRFPGGVDKMTVESFGMDEATMAGLATKLETSHWRPPGTQVPQNVPSQSPRQRYYQDAANRVEQQYHQALGELTAARQQAQASHVISDKDRKFRAASGQLTDARQALAANETIERTRATVDGHRGQYNQENQEIGRAAHDLQLAENRRAHDAAANNQRIRQQNAVVSNARQNSLIRESEVRQAENGFRSAELRLHTRDPSTLQSIRDLSPRSGPPGSSSLDYEAGYDGLVNERAERQRVMMAAQYVADRQNEDARRAHQTLRHMEQTSVPRPPAGPAPTAPRPGAPTRWRGAGQASTGPVDRARQEYENRDALARSATAEYDRRRRMFEAADSAIQNATQLVERFRVLSRSSAARDQAANELRAAQNQLQRIRAAATATDARNNQDVAIESNALQAHQNAATRAEQLLRDAEKTLKKYVISQGLLEAERARKP